MNKQFHDLKLKERKAMERFYKEHSIEVSKTIMNKVKNKAKCACDTVVYKPLPLDSGHGFAECWVCVSCGAEFIRMPEGYMKELPPKKHSRIPGIFGSLSRFWIWLKKYFTI